MFNDKAIHKKVCITLALLVLAILVILFFISNFPIQTAYFFAGVFALFFVGMVYLAFYFAFSQ